MRSLLLVASFILAAPDRPDPSPKARPDGPEKQFLGEWQLEKMAMGAGMPAPNETEKRILRITPGEIKVLVNGLYKAEDGATYRADWTKQPIEIDIIPRSGTGKALSGILKIEQDQLTWCFAILGPRPNSFNLNAGESNIVMHLKRVSRQAAK